VLTEEAVKECAGLADEVVESIIRVLKDEAIYQEHPRVLARRVIDLFEGERYKAVRWARTFSADVATNTTLYRYKQQGIEECQFYATIDHKTSPQCRTLHGTVFKTDSSEAKQYKVPLHPHCRSCILPITSLTVVDDSLRYENRDFTKPVDQRFKQLDSVDADLVKGTFKNIYEFRDKWAVPQFILDEDIEKRLAKLSVGVSTS
jgi:SPP1 gp7 family putative phage head morphogenesis protein